MTAPGDDNAAVSCFPPILLAGQAPPTLPNRVSFPAEIELLNGKRISSLRLPETPRTVAPVGSKGGALLLEPLSKWPKEGLFRAMAGRG